MKKIGLYVLSFALVFTLAGCGKKEENSKMKNDMAIEGDYNQNEQGDVEVMENGVLANLKNSLSAGKKIKCSYQINDKDETMGVVETYIQGDKYKTESTIDGIKNISIFDGDIVYSWIDGQKMGTKMSMDCINNLNGNKEEIKENIPVEDEEGFVNSLGETNNLECGEAGDIDFDLPSEIEFSDQCEILKSQQQLIEGFTNYTE